jgi:hypothetical protein
MLAAQFNLGVFLLEYFLICVICFAAAALIGTAGKAVGPPLARRWQQSALRAWYRRLSKATICFVDGVTANALVVFFNWPLMMVPPGSGVKPMYLPCFLIVIAAACIASCTTLAADTERPSGPRLVRAFGTLLCLTPLPLGVILMHVIAAMRDLTFG